MTIEEYFGDWAKVIDLKEVEKIMKRLSGTKRICPMQKDIFKAFNLCSMHALKVCIIGQDPYPTIRNNMPVATGIAFANSSDTPESSYSPSLEVLRASVIDFTIPHRTIIFDPSLEKWEEQGVLLLNSALTCITGIPGSHALLWKPFMKNFLTKLSRYTTGIVYVLMGSSAQYLEPYINKELNYVIRIRHPAWYVRNKKRMPSDIWYQINDIIKGQNGNEIEWYTEY